VTPLVEAATPAVKINFMGDSFPRGIVLTGREHKL